MLLMLADVDVANVSQLTLRQDRPCQKLKIRIRTKPNKKQNNHFGSDKNIKIMDSESQ